MTRDPILLITPDRRAATVHAGPRHGTRELRERYGLDELGAPRRLTIVRGREAPVGAPG